MSVVEPHSDLGTAKLPNIREALREFARQRALGAKVLAREPFPPNELYNAVQLASAKYHEAFGDPPPEFWSRQEAMEAVCDAAGLNDKNNSRYIQAAKKLQQAYELIGTYQSAEAFIGERRLSQLDGKIPPQDIIALLSHIRDNLPISVIENQVRTAELSREARAKAGMEHLATAKRELIEASQGDSSSVKEHAVDRFATKFAANWEAQRELDRTANLDAVLFPIIYNIAFQALSGGIQSQTASLNLRESFSNPGVKAYFGVPYVVGRS